MTAARTAYPAPSTTYGVRSPSTSDGTTPPTPTAAVAAAIPDRHHASQVRSAASRVRRVTSSSDSPMGPRLAYHRAHDRADHDHECEHQQPRLKRKGDANQAVSLC